MKNSVLLVTLLCILLGARAKADEYRIVTEEWAPYNYLQDGQLTGLTTEVVNAIMALTGDNFPIEAVPSMRATYDLRQQPKTIMYSLFRTPERESSYRWVGPIAEEAIYPYQLASSEEPIHSLAQLMQAQRITTRHAGLVPDTLDSLGFRNLDRSATQNVQLYRMLLAGRTQIIVGDTPAGVAYYSRLLQIPAGTLRQIPLELFRSSLYIAFSRDSSEAVVTRWAEALDQLRSSGKLEQIRLAYE